jgi:hypothetical protein
MRSPSGRLSRVAEPPGSALVVELARQYGLSHADLHRILPRFPGADLTISGNECVLVFDEGRRLTLVLGPQQERRLGLIRIPYTDLRFRFTGWEHAEIERFWVRFDRMFQKGGG